MAKLKVRYYSEIDDQNLKKEVTELLEQMDIDLASALDNYSAQIVDAKVVTDEDGTVYDVQLFDPYHHASHRCYINFDGTSNWLLEYRDLDGNDMDSILEDYNGVPQQGGKDM